ncbi:hypothetical protein BCD_1611, partial (plasmid) [Borrelia crocidurae DOU]
MFNKIKNSIKLSNVNTNHPYIDYYKKVANEFCMNHNDKDHLRNFFCILKNKIQDIDKHSTEAEIEYLVSNIFELLNYSCKQQKSGNIEGNKSRVDILLFENKQVKKEFEIKLEDAKRNRLPIPTDKILLLIEVKKPSFGNWKEAEEQIYRYLNQYKKDYGILTNGYKWRLYDKSKVFYGDKNYIEFNLEKMAENDFENQEEAALFYYFISKDRYLNNAIKRENEEIIKDQNTIKKTLKEILYEKPYDSIVFKIAKNIYIKEFNSNPNITAEELNKILEESIIFVLRIFFIAYIEDLFDETLKNHIAYRTYVSFRYYFYDKVLNGDAGYGKLIKIFELLDNGNENFEFPMFNGGLFSKEKAHYLNNNELLSKDELKEILVKVFFFDQENALNQKFVQYSKIDLKSFGELYETLLEYDLRIAENTLHHIFKNGTYCIQTDEMIFSKKEKDLNKAYFTYYRGDIYLTSRSLDRKKSGAYYTPDDLTEFMVVSAIEEQLKNKSPLDLKIIDNSCGSGHFLISSLNYLTEKVWYEIDKFDDVKENLEKEYEIISNESKKYGIKDIDKKLVLKRMLLKKCIYGVDINPIAVEVTMLSLWINTFIFGTPLSFIEHHIKVGDALIGYMKDEFINVVQEKLKIDISLWSSSINKIVDTLKNVYSSIQNVDDLTKEEIRKSKKIYDDAQSNKNALKLIFSLIKIYELYSIKSLDFRETIQFDSGEYSVLELMQNILNKNLTDENKVLIEKIEQLSTRYKFFHYGVEFPDAQDGFEIVIGNPPWEKVKFDEEEFFSKYIPDYRRLSLSEQKTVKTKIINSSLNEQLNKEKNNIRKLNDIYKSGFSNFINGGDPNFFRYFVGLNLKLVARNGNLTYLTPASLWNELSSQSLRKFIFNNYKINFLYQFENKKRFKDVDLRFKFAIFQITNSQIPESSFKVQFLIQNDDTIIQEITNNLKLLENKSIAYKGLDLSIDKIKKFSHIQEAVIEFKSNEELILLSKLFNQFKVLSDKYINFKKGIDPSVNNNKELLKEDVSDKSDYVFLYQGANIHQFNSRYFEHKSSKEKSKLLWISNKNKEKILPNENLGNNISILYRDIASNTNERTMISTLVPRDCYCTNSIYISYDNHGKIQMSIYKKLFIISIFNSLTFDFLIRKFVNIHVQKSCLYQCPMPQPEEAEILNVPLNLTLARNACILTVRNNPDSFKELLNLKYFNFAEAEKQKILNLKIEDEFFEEVENEINFIVAYLYSLNFEDFRILLEDFKVL